VPFLREGARWCLRRRLPGSRQSSGHGQPPTHCRSCLPPDLRAWRVQPERPPTPAVARGYNGGYKATSAPHNLLLGGGFEESATALSRLRHRFKSGYGYQPRRPAPEAPPASAAPSSGTNLLRGGTFPFGPGFRTFLGRLRVP